MQGTDERSSAGGPNEVQAELVSRREFLKIAGVAGVFAGLGAGLGGFLASCKGAQKATNTTATIPVGQTTSTVAGSATATASSGPETGRDIKIGLVSAKTGPLALFGKADDWWTRFALAAVPDGVLCGDRKFHKFAFVRDDSRSDPQRAAQIAARMITDGGVDIIMCSGGADMVNPVADQAETLGCPCLSSFVQWRPFVFGRGRTAEEPFKWTYAHAIGLEDIAGNYVAMWEQLETNRMVGFIFADDAGGRVWTDATTGLPPAVAAAGYSCVLPAPYPVPTQDFTAHISEFNKNGCEICCGALTAADFITFWRQAVEQDYHPKVVTIGEGVLFPQALEAVGPIARNVTTESLWQPSWPYKDSITGRTSQELANDYVAKTGDQWTATLAQYAKFEWAVDVFKRVRIIGSKEDAISKVRTTKLQTCLGPIDFTTPVDTADASKSKRPLENVYKAPVGGAQWLAGKSFAFEPELVTNVDSPTLVVAGRVKPMAYES